MRTLVTANTEALEQMLSLIKTAPRKAYQDIPEGMTSAVGRHVRHVFDHYVALQTGMTEGKIDYDQRSRDSAIEKDSGLAIQQLLILIDWLKEHIRIDVPLKMKTEVSVSCQESVIVDSSLRREMIYLLNHTVHHVAYITLVLRTLGVQVDHHIGNAPATQSYIRSNDIKKTG